MGNKGSMVVTQTSSGFTTTTSKKSTDSGVVANKFVKQKASAPAVPEVNDSHGSHAPPKNVETLEEDVQKKTNETHVEASPVSIEDVMENVDHPDESTEEQVINHLNSSISNGEVEVKHDEVHSDVHVLSSKIEEPIKDRMEDLKGEESSPEDVTEIKAVSENSVTVNSSDEVETENVKEITLIGETSEGIVRQDSSAEIVLLNEGETLEKENIKEETDVKEEDEKVNQNEEAEKENEVRISSPATSPQSEVKSEVRLDLGFQDSYIIPED